jgi:hypothetical protein
MAATSTRLATIDVKGGLWGPDLLAALAEGRSKLPAETVTAESYDLPMRASTEQTARAAWTVLTAAWEEFTEHHQKRIAVFETPTYGADSFTWDKWTRHLLDQLGYDPEATPAGGLRVDNADPEDLHDSYPISHTHHDQIPIHAVPAGVELDRRAAGVKGAARQSPHSLLQDYLNRTSRHLWGLVTNGLSLRLLRDNAALSRQAFIELDLAAIFEEGAYADFALLWHAAHASRFNHDPDEPATACIAETWQEHATKTGVAALEDLRDGVEAAIAEIGQGLIEHRDNTALREALADPDDPDDPFDPPAFYRELLYIAYRHVFWFALDDRNLLHPDSADRAKVAAYRDHYASTVLRHKARSHLGARHPDGWAHFQTVAGWFADSKGCLALDIPGLLGRLWDPEATPHLNGTTLTNRRYYEALRRLGYVQRDGVPHRINYDAMGSEELGAVYESLLEIRPVADPASRTFTPDRTHGSDRKKTGSYYTPTSLIKVLLDEALDPVLDDRSKQAVHELPPDATPEQERKAQDRALLGTTICDPAMGSAHFLVAAGMRLAKRLASVRTEEVEPSPEAVQQAFRAVASRCLYGVDVNPMAVELAKLAIWLECHVPGQPLTFLDHHLKHGDALLGVGFDPDLIAWHKTAKKAADQKGVPDAAFKPLAGDDKKHARALRDKNKDRRGRGTGLRFRSAGAHVDDLDHLADVSRHVTDLEDDTPAALAAKQQAWTEYEHEPELERQRLRANAWTASWTITKRPDVTDPLTTDDPFADDDLPWDIYYDTFFDDDIDPSRVGVRTVRREAERLNFFHWYVEFPDIANAGGGFSLMLGNPPWEHTELKEKEWFSAAGYDDIADAQNASQRKKKIAALAESDDPVDRQTAAQWEQDSRDAQTTSEFARNGERFPLGGVGRVNTYALFADHFVQSVAQEGRIGIIVPTGLVTDYTYRDFFATLVDQRRLAAAYDFENRRKLFPEVDSRFRFVTLIATAPGEAPEARFAFMVHDTSELEQGVRTYVLTPEQIELVNPNTKTAPVFMSPRDAEITTGIYERHPVLVQHGHEQGNPWSITLGRVFNMADDSGSFADEPTDLDAPLPLYEAKMFHHFDHRWATYEGGDAVAVGPAQKRDPSYEPSPRYWVEKQSFREKIGDREFFEPILLSWRDITRNTDQRTTIACLLPYVAVAHGSPLIGFGEHPLRGVLLSAFLSSFALDYVARQQLSGTHMTMVTVEQLPVPAPATLERAPAWRPDMSMETWLAARSSALSATTHTMAEALGYSEPAIWDDKERELWRTELDAAIFCLYGYSRDDVGYVLDTFPVVARKDRKAEGLDEDDRNWRTKRLILEKYDELSRHAETGTAYESPHAPPPLPERLRMAGNAVSSNA